MADTKISNLTSATTPLAGTEVLPIVQSGSTVKVANNDLRPKQIQSNATSGVLQVVGPGASATRVMTVPDANFTAARTDAGQTFTGTQAFGRITGTSAALGSGATTLGLVEIQTGATTAALWVQTGGTTASYVIADFRSGTNASALAITADLNTTINGNLVPATAAKGINFTANTAAAGMTSQLLNWYEEGTWTPNQGAGLTVIGAFTSSGKYTRIGRQVTIYGYVNGATNVAVAAGGVICTNAPYTSSIFSQGSAANGTPAQGIVVSISSATVYAAAVITASNGIYFTITYFV